MSKSAALFLLFAASTCAFTPTTHASASSVTKKSFIRDTTSLSAAENPVESFLSGFFPKKDVAVVEKIPDFVCDSDYTLGITFLGIAGVILGLSVVVEGGYPSLFGGVAAALHALLGSLFVVQAGRIRFVFDQTAFELKNAGAGEELNESGDNIVVGGANRWNYDEFVNYDFFPSIDVPILVYFKETQTPQDKWNEGPGELDKVGGGQIHFFPVIANVRQLKEQFELRGCAKK